MAEEYRCTTVDTTWQQDKEICSACEFVTDCAYGGQITKVVRLTEIAL